MNSFRPLSGSYISQLDHSQFAPELHLQQVSVPYRGATFLNKLVRAYRKEIRVSVPYRGATFLNLTRVKFHPARFTDVSVPYRGATFLNTPEC